MKFWQTVSKCLRSTSGSRELIEEADLHKLYLCLEWNIKYQTKAVALEEEPEQVAESISALAASLSLDELRRAVKLRVEEQVRALVRDEDNSANNDGLNDAACRGFRIVVQPSAIPSAGRGVFIDGNASLGQVVALMPGLVYSKDYHRDIPGYPSFGDESMFLMSRYDGHMVDSRAWEHFKTSTSNLREYNAARRKREGLDYEALLGQQWFHEELRENGCPFALGHFINHPPESVAPNVLAAPVDWTEKDVSKIPWGPYRIPGEAGDHAVPGLAFVATRPIEDGEELLVNYRLNPGVLGGLPQWYVSVDEVEDEQRWA